MTADATCRRATEAELSYNRAYDWSRASRGRSGRCQFLGGRTKNCVHFGCVGPCLGLMAKCTNRSFAVLGTFPQGTSPSHRYMEQTEANRVRFGARKHAHGVEVIGLDENGG